MEEAKMIDFREYIENYLNPKEPVCDDILPKKISSPSLF